MRKVWKKLTIFSIDFQNVFSMSLLSIKSRKISPENLPDKMIDTKHPCETTAWWLQVYFSVILPWKADVIVCILTDQVSQSTVNVSDLFIISYYFGCEGNSQISTGSSHSSFIPVSITALESKSFNEHLFVRRTFVRHKKRQTFIKTFLKRISIIIISSGRISSAK